jgi:hypothetical protein
MLVNARKDITSQARRNLRPPRAKLKKRIQLRYRRLSYEVQAPPAELGVGCADGEEADAEQAGAGLGACVGLAFGEGVGGFVGLGLGVAVKGKICLGITARARLQKAEAPRIPLSPVGVGRAEFPPQDASAKRPLKSVPSTEKCFSVQ